MTHDLPFDDTADRALRHAGDLWAAAAGEAPSADFLARLDARIAEPAAPARVLDLGAMLRRAPALWAAAAALLVVAGLALWNAGQPERVGALAFAKGSVEAPVELRTGTRLAAGADSGAIAMLDGQRIALTLNEQSAVAFAGDDRVRLDSGEAWFDVRPNSGRFVVETAQGTVTVKGTSFGVRVASGATEVTVASGIVELSRGGESVDLRAGEAGEIPAEGPPIRRATGATEPPAWARGLQSQLVSRYYPSGQPGAGS